MTLRMYAERKEWPLTGISVSLSHDRIEVDGMLRERITRTIDLNGSLSEAQRTRLLEIAGKCPVHRALSQPFMLDCQLAD